MGILSSLVGWKLVAASSAAAAIVAGIAGFTSGMFVQGAFKDRVISSRDGTISELKLEKADNRANVAEGIIDRIKSYVDGTTLAVQDFNRNQGTLIRAVNGIAGRLADAQAHNPLPADCKPPADRMQLLTEAIAAANAAAARRNEAAGQPPGEGVPTNSGPGR